MTVLDAQFAADSVLDGLRDLVHLVGVVLVGELLDDHHVRLADGEHEVALAVLEEVLYHLQHGHVRALHLPYQEHGAGHVGDEVQLLGADVHIAPAGYCRR